MDSAGGGGGGGGLLSEPDDERYLSALVCFVRQNIEYFEATEADEKARRQSGGFNFPITPGRVGIRCVHCRDLPPRQRGSGSTGFPKSVALINQAVRNYQRYHIKVCPSMPEDVRERYA
jgi:hypothetical protein